MCRCKKNSHPTALEAAVRQDLSSEQHCFSAEWFKESRWSKAGTGSYTGQWHQSGKAGQIPELLDCAEMLG